MSAAVAVALSVLVFHGSSLPAGARPADRSAATKAGGSAIDSVVVLGDSVAAGEGARDGFVYRDRVLLPFWSSSGRRARTDTCGRSSSSYGVRVARALGAEVVNLACSGASFEHGIELGARFGAARPDLVLVTAGANSVDFERAYAYCVLSASGMSEAEAERVVRSSSVEDALGTAVGIGARRIFGRGPSTSRPSCTAANPGAYLEETVLDRADDVGEEARALADAIRARGEELGLVPEIVFTTYPDPLPDTATTFARCPDGAGLGTEELGFMHGLFAALNDGLRSALVGVPNVRVADPDRAFVGHRWCDGDPWVHGPSILVTDPSSRAPFHPTSAGQRAIADAVLAARSAVPGEWRGVV